MNTSDPNHAAGGETEVEITDLSWGGRRESRPQAGIIDVSHDIGYNVKHETETSIPVQVLPH